jgi:hypothetical protein
VAISRVDTTIATVGVTATSITPSAPVGVAVGDLIIVMAAISKSGNSWANASYAGWTMLETGLTSGSLDIQVMYRIATGSGDAPPAMAVTATQTGGMVAMVAVYRGVDTTSPFIGVPASRPEPGTTTAHVSASVTNTDPDAWGVLGGVARQVPTPLTWTADAPLLELEDADNGVANNNNVAGLWADTNGPAATGTFTYTGNTSAATGGAIMWSAILRPGVTFATLSGVVAMAASSGLSVGGSLSGTGTLSMSALDSFTIGALQSSSASLPATAASALTIAAVRSQLVTLSMAAGSSSLTVSGATGAVSTLSVTASGLFVVSGSESRSAVVAAVAASALVVGPLRTQPGVLAVAGLSAATFGTILGQFAVLPMAAQGLLVPNTGASAVLAVRGTPVLSVLSQQSFLRVLSMRATPSLAVAAVLIPDYHPGRRVAAIILDSGKRLVSIDYSAGGSVMLSDTGLVAILRGF